MELGAYAGLPPATRDCGRGWTCRRWLRSTANARSSSSSEAATSRCRPSMSRLPGSISRATPREADAHADLRCPDTVSPPRRRSTTTQSGTGGHYQRRHSSGQVLQRHGRSSRASTAPGRCLTGGSAPRQGRQHPSRVSTCSPAPGDPAPERPGGRPCSVGRGARWDPLSQGGHAGHVQSGGAGHVPRSRPDGDHSPSLPDGDWSSRYPRPGSARHRGPSTRPVPLSPRAQHQHTPLASPATWARLAARASCARSLTRTSQPSQPVHATRRCRDRAQDRGWDRDWGSGR